MWAEDWFNGELCLCNNSSSPALTLWHKHLAQSNSRAQVLDSVENKPTVSWFSQLLEDAAPSVTYGIMQNLKYYK